MTYEIDPKTIARVLPCPFCGSDPEVMGSGERGRGLMIHCIAPNCPNPSTSYYDHETALAVWNRRARFDKAYVERLERIIALYREINFCDQVKLTICGTRGIIK